MFKPKPDGIVSFEALKQTLKKAGYTLASADITIVGKLVREGDRWLLISNQSGQRFWLEGKTEDLLAKTEADSVVEITGNWKTTGVAATAKEVVEIQTVKKPETKTIGAIKKINFDRESEIKFINASFLARSIPDSSKLSDGEQPKSLAPIRTTSPGLTVYQGGGVTPRFYFIKQHLGELDVTKQILNISVSYTPSPRLQLEAELPIARSSFDDGAGSGSIAGLGNITLWSKYRFFRKVKTYGDRQASVRFGLELPTGKKDAPSAADVNVPEFVRQQLTPINGGLSPHFDVAFSQAGGRFIFGGNIEGIVRTERGGFRMGHEVRVNTDFEYVLLPRDYQKPGKELFVILESSFVVRGHGRLNGQIVSGSTSTEYFLSPGLQYAAAPQFVVEGSLQFPVFRNAGAQVLRTDLNFLLGIRYLF